MIIFGEIHHFGYVYKDGEEAIKKFKDLFGIEEFARFNYIVVKVVRAMIGRLQVDIIEPQDENSIFYEFLKNGNVGFHHIGFQVDDVDEKIKEWDSKGFKQVNKGIIGPAKFVYFDATDTLGYIVEFAQIDYKQS
ncbi:MAG: VOC family protein [Promethearchaeota archaeon]